MPAVEDADRTTLVLPFYDEAARLDLGALQRLAGSSLDLVLVDDGSTDDTRALLAGFLTGAPGTLLTLDVNAGKGEAVRRGLLAALDAGADLVGYADSDLATPVEEILRVAALARDARNLDVLLGSRLKLAGRVMQRRAMRHYLGRVIATYIDTRTRLGVYDTQCGLKFLRASPELRAALARPFATRWLFDVELLRRLRIEHAASGRPLRMREEPLETWVDVAGSRISRGELLRVARDFVLLERSMRDSGA